MDIEKWKNIEGYEAYQVSSLGRVKCVVRFVKLAENKYVKIPRNPFLRPKMLKATVRNGYPTCKLRENNGINRKTAYLYLEVAKAFVPKPDNTTIVKHIDGNLLNNRADNLEWTVD